MADRELTALLRFRVEGKSLDQLEGRLAKLRDAQKQLEQDSKAATLAFQKAVAAAQQAGQGKSLEALLGDPKLDALADQAIQLNVALNQTKSLINQISGAIEYDRARYAEIAERLALYREEADAIRETKAAQDELSSSSVDTQTQKIRQLDADYISLGNQLQIVAEKLRALQQQAAQPGLDAQQVQDYNNEIERLEGKFLSLTDRMADIEHQQLGTELGEVIQKLDAMKAAFDKLKAESGDSLDPKLVKEYTQEIDKLQKRHDALLKTMEGLEAQQGKLYKAREPKAAAQEPDVLPDGSLSEKRMRQLSEEFNLRQRTTEEIREATEAQSRLTEALNATLQESGRVSKAQQIAFTWAEAWQMANAEVNSLSDSLEALKVKLAEGKITQQQYDVELLKLRREFVTLDNTAQTVLTTFSKLDTAIRKFAKQQKLSADEVQLLSAALRLQEKYGNDAAKVLERVTAGKFTPSEVEKTVGQMRSEAYEYGRIGMSFRAVGRGVSRVMGVQSVEPLFAAGDIIRGIRGLKLLEAELPNLWKRMVYGNQVVETLGEAFETATSAQLAHAAGLEGLRAKTAATAMSTAGLAAIVGAAAAAIAGLVIAIDFFGKQTAKAKQATENFMQVSQRYAQITTSQSSQEIRNTIEEQRVKDRAARAERDRLRDFLDAVEDSVNTGSVVERLGGALVNLADAVGLNMAGVDKARDRYNELNSELTNSASLVSQLTLALSEMRAMGSDFIGLIEQYPGAARTASRDEFGWLAGGYVAAPGAGFMTTKEATEQAELIAAQIRALQEERGRRLVQAGTGAPGEREFAVERIAEIDEDIAYLSGVFNDIATAVNTGVTKIVDEWEKRQIDFEFDQQSGQRALTWAQSINQLQSEIQTMALSPGTPEDVAKQLEGMNIQLQAQREMVGNIKTLHEQGVIDYATYKQALYDANQAVGLTKYQIKLMEDVLKPAAEALEDYNDELERSKEAHQRLLDWIREENKFLMEASSRALTEDDPQAVLDDIYAIQMNLGGWKDHLKELDGQLKKGVITQDDYRELAGETDTAMRSLKREMGLLKGEVLPAARATEEFNDELDRLESKMELAAEQARVDADRERELLREQEDFERSRARALAAHNAQLAEMDADLAERIQDELARAGVQADGELKKRLDLEADHYKDMQRMAEDHARSMWEINRDLTEGIEEAVSDRDVQAAIRAIKDARKATEDEQYEYDKQRRRREEDFQARLAEMDEETSLRKKDYRDRIAELKAQHAKEKAERIADFEQRLKEEDEDNEIRAKRRQEDWDREDKDREDHYTDTENDWKGHYKNLRLLALMGMTGVEFEVSKGWGKVVSAGIPYMTVLDSMVASAAAKANQIGFIANSLSSQQQKQDDLMRKMDQQQDELESLLRMLSFSSTSYVSSGGYNPLTNRTITQYGTGTNRAKLDEWVLLGDTGPEAARFHGDGRWEVLNPRKTQQALGRQGTQIAISMPVSIHDASNPQQIEAIFESRVLPKLTREVSRAVHARGA